MERRIYRVSAEDYQNLADEIRGRLLSPCYFTGAVEVVGHDDTLVRLVASLILYRRRPDRRNDFECYDTISGVSAVWWDVVCEDEEGLVYDDFDFDELVKCLIEEED